MPIRRNTFQRTDVSQGLQNMLYKNGMQAHISWTAENGPQLIVLGHDSPVLTYNINEKQMENLMGWGSTFANKKAYNTFISIVGNDFHLPESFVAAGNAFGRVAMGLHGYRLGHGEYGYDARIPRMPYYSPFTRHGRGWAGDFLGWAPRTEGFHLRRVGGRLYAPDGPMVPERPDGRIKPGELRSGGYGFYYKGQQQTTPSNVLDILAIEPVLSPLNAAPRPQGQGIPFSDAIFLDSEITNAFTPGKFKEVLASHGIVIDEAKKTLTIQSNLSKVDMQYTLSDEELKKLTAKSVKGNEGVTVDERLAVINNIISKDFAEPITMEMLETKELVSIDLKPEVRAEVEAPFIEQERLIAKQAKINKERAEQEQEAERIRRDPNAINGREIQAIMGNKGWFQPVKNGREMYVAEIRVDSERDIIAKTLKENFETTPEEFFAHPETAMLMTEDNKKLFQEVKERYENGEGKYIMTAVINGRTVEHSISAEDYRKFLELDDKHRLKMFDDVFTEVKIKSAHGRSLYDDGVYMAQDGQTVIRQENMDIAHTTSNRVDGSTLQNFDERKGFYHERAHGREVEVGDITVQPENNGKYKMTAVINGQAISHEITQKQYDKFLAVDDYHRMQLFDKIFDEVEIKTRPGMGHNVGAAILAAIVATGEVLTGDMCVRHGPRPEIYESRMPGTLYTKPGVVHPEDLAAANFRSEEANLRPATDEHMGRGL